jgi:hypothetical protein
MPDGFYGQLLLREIPSLETLSCIRPVFDLFLNSFSLKNSQKKQEAWKPLVLFLPAKKTVQREDGKIR